MVSNISEFLVVSLTDKDWARMGLSLDRCLGGSKVHMDIGWHSIRSRVALSGGSFKGAMLAAK